MKDAKRFPRPPPGLLREVFSALEETDKLIPRDEVIDWLEVYRRFGAATGAIVVRGKRLLSIPREYLGPLSRLDTAFRVTDRFRKDVPAFINRAVLAHLGRSARTTPASTKFQHSEIARFVSDRGYITLPRGRKKQVLRDAMDHFGCSEKTVRNAIRMLVARGPE
jgi:hypothetical protein